MNPKDTGSEGPSDASDRQNEIYGGERETESKSDGVRERDIERKTASKERERITRQMSVLLPGESSGKRSNTRRVWAA